MGWSVQAGLPTRQLHEPSPAVWSLASVPVSLAARTRAREGESLEWHQVGMGGARLGAGASDLRARAGCGPPLAVPSRETMKSRIPPWESGALCPGRFLPTVAAGRLDWTAERWVSRNGLTRTSPPPADDLCVGCRPKQLPNEGRYLARVASSSAAAVLQHETGPSPVTMRSARSA